MDPSPEHQLHPRLALARRALRRLTLLARPATSLALVFSLALALAGQAAAEADLRQVQQEMVAKFAAKDYAGAEASCRTLLAARPANADAAYNLACALARRGLADEAMRALAQADANGFADAAHLLEDDDLASLRERADFKRLAETMRAKPYTGGASYEPGEAIAGVRSIEDAPQAGLRYRLRLGEHASPERPHRLVVWLHPSGGSADRQVEALSPSLAEHGYGLVVFSQKPYLGWTGDELARIAPTIAEIAKHPGVDAAHPVLMGFSAGGQAALELWYQSPAVWSGLLLDAAYPLDLAKGIAAEAVVEPTKAAFAAKTPMLALVGANDGGLRIWSKALPVWTAAGLPVTLRPVAGRGHEYLFAGEEWTAALSWLDANVTKQVSAEKP